MNCAETRRLLDAALDGELDAAHGAEIDAHLRGCADCSALAAATRERNAVLRDRLPRYTAPAALAATLRSRFGATTATSAATAVPLPSRPILFPVLQVIGLAASLALAALGGYAWAASRASADRLLNDALADHVRSLQVDHLTDVASTDQHTVKPWFAGKLDFSPPVTDLAAAGFPLIGGRLEQLDGRTAAALVFRRRQHVINVFVWRAPTAVPASASTRGGFHVESWSEGDLHLLAVSEIPAAELAEFTAAFRAATR